MKTSLFAVLVSLPLAGISAEFSTEQLDFFEKKIRPVLAERCYECHSAGAKKLKAHLQLDHREHLLKGGDTGAAMVPGDPDVSLLVETISYNNRDMQMPPKGKLDDSVIADFKKWIADGAPWPDESVPTRDGGAMVEKFDLEKRRAEHWCWRPIQNPTPPTITNGNWPINEIDQFILKGIEESGLKPTGPANKRIWLRRVTFDLIGLPPTAGEIAAFLADESPAAHETVVDRLLSSPHYGEKWARHWMDLIRYAESYGHEFDYPIDFTHEYRDYLIRAFNADLPYDQLVTEHVAGDLLKDPRRNPNEQFNESILGTGFWFFHEATHAPTDVRQDEVDRMDNQVDVFGKTFLGLTISCARCHDHKFDAISTADYYAMTAYIESSARQEYPMDPGRARENSLVQLSELQKKADSELAGSSFNYKPGEYLTAAADLVRNTARTGSEPTPPADEKIAEAAKKSGLDSEKLKAWCQLFVSTEKDDKKPEGFFSKWLNTPDVANGIKNLAKRHEETLANLDKVGTLFEDFEADTLPDGWSTSGFAFQPTGSKIQLSFSDGDHFSIPGLVSSQLYGTKQNGVLRSPTFKITTNQIHVKTRSESLFARVVIDNFHMQKFNGLLFRGTLNANHKTDGEFRWLTFNADLKKYIGHNAYLEFVDKGGAKVEIDEIWFNDQGAPPSELPAILIAATSGDGNLQDNLNATWASTLSNLKDGSATARNAEWLNWMLKNGLIDLSDISEKLPAILAEGKKITDQLPGERYALAMAEGTPEGSFVHIRGSHRKLGEAVPRRVLTALGGREGDRLALAADITTLENPLTSRVIVNRLWHHLFGRGIVASVDDFGPMGQEPSHPELLDFLATDHVKNGWSIKQSIRKMVLSQTYRQSSDPNSELDLEQIAITDPENILLHRMPVRRLQAEAIRDSILKISGRLDPKMFGKSIPTHRTAFMTGRGGRGSGPLDGAGRRSVYGSIYRNFLSPMMLTFDMPGPFGPKGRRSVSNVPAQALTLMNDPFVIEQAKIWAKNSLSKNPDITPEARISAMFETAFGKLPEDDEQLVLKQFLDQQIADYGGKLDERAWADVAHVMFNLKDFVYLN